MKIKKSFLAAALIFVSAFNLFSQEHPEYDSLEELLSENQSASENGINPDLQKDFIIVEAVHSHDLNPQTTSYTSDSEVLTGLYEGLFSYNPVTLEPQPALATDYKVSRDKKRMTFTLRQDAYFSNGQQITAEDVRFSWLQLLKTPDAPYASLLDIIRGAADYRKGKITEEEVGIYAVSQFTLSIYLTSPANYLPRVFCHSAFSVINRNPTVYSGPFYLDNYTKDTLVLKKNPYYWDKANTHLEQITFVQSQDTDENAFLFNTGKASWITSDVATDKIINKSALLFGGEFGTSYYFFKINSKKASVWNYAEFRNVIVEAMPWDEIRKGTLIPAETFVYPLSGYPQIEGYSYTDLIEAKNKLKDAKAKYNIPQEQELTLNFEISEYTLTEEKSQILVSAFKELGINLVITKLPSDIYLSSVPYSTADLFAYTWIGDFADPLAFLSLFQGSSTLNDSGWQNADFDALLEKAATVSDSERLNLLSQAEVILLDEAVVLPIFHPVSFNLINLEEVGGWSSNAFDIHPLKYLYKKQSKSSLPNIVMK